ncbi:retrovirus-related pol polyprotein from transposon TNT 1-94 [Tanacetum coccineum]
MRELIFFLELQVKQKEDGIFISQDKYVTKILKKFGFTNVKTVSTPMETQKPLLKDEDGEKVDAKTVNEEVQLQAVVDGKKVIITESTIRRDLQLEDAEGIDCLPNATIFEQLTLMGAATTASSLEAEQDSGNILKTRSKATPNEPSSPGTSSGGGPRRQETIGDTIAQTRSKNVSKLLNDPLLEITSLKRRVKRLEEKGRSRTHGLKRLYKVGLSRRVESSYEEGLGEEDASKQGRIADIDADAGINLVSTHFDADTDMFGVHDLVGDEVVVEREVAIKAASIIPVSAATTTKTVITNDDITLLKELSQLKSAKLPTTTASTTIIVMSTRPRAKGLGQPTRAQQRSFMCTYLKNMEGWKPKDLKNKSFVNIQELFDKAMKRVNTFVDYRTELVEESSKKAKAEIAQESNSKRAVTELEQESIKKQKVDEDKETVELQRLIEVLPDKRGSSN